MNVNIVILAGRLTRDPEMHGKVCSFGLAINRKGKKGDETTFLDCKAFGATAEIIGDYFEKGKPIFIEGRLALEEWEGRDGGRRSKLVVYVNRFEFFPKENPAGDRQPRAADVADDEEPF